MNNICFSCLGQLDIFGETFIRKLPVAAKAALNCFYRCQRSDIALNSIILSREKGPNLDRGCVL